MFARRRAVANVEDSFASYAMQRLGYTLTLASFVLLCGAADDGRGPRPSKTLGGPPARRKASASGRATRRRSGFADFFGLMDLVMAMFGGIAGAEVASILGYHPCIGYLVAFGLLYLPSAAIFPFASDFAEDEQGEVCIRPNRAARVLHVLEYIRDRAFIIGFVSVPLFPVGVFVGLRGRLLAVFLLGISIVLYATVEGAPWLIKTYRKWRSK